MIVRRLHFELGRALKLPDIEKGFDERGVPAGNMSPEQLGGFIRSETAKWGSVVKKPALRRG